MTLYELADQYRELQQMLENPEIPEDCIRDTLEGIAGEIDEKAENIACIIKALDTEAKAIRAEEIALADRRKAKENQIDNLKQYLVDQLTALNIKKIDRPRAVVSIREAASVEITDEEQFVRWAEQNRDDLLTCKVSISKTAIKDAIKGGAEIPFAGIVTKKGVVLK